MQDKAEFFIVSEREKALYFETPTKSEAETRDFQIIPEMMVEIIVTIYKIIPSFIEPRIPMPTPDITKAIDGFAHNGNRVSNSS